MPLPRFHLAFPVRDLGEAREFYGGLLGCPEGRSCEDWVDFDFRGHQIVAHKAGAIESANSNEVDGKMVPVRHFGLILGWDEWHELADHLRSDGIHFDIEPHIRFAGEPGEQATMFFRDPSGNALEFKAFRSDEQIFAR